MRPYYLSHVLRCAGEAHLVARLVVPSAKEIRLVGTREALSAVTPPTVDLPPRRGPPCAIFATISLVGKCGAFRWAFPLHFDQSALGG